MYQPETTRTLQPDALETELRARERYWHRQEQEEVRVAEHLGHLSRELLSIPGKDARRQVRPRGAASWPPPSPLPRLHRFLL